MCFTFVIYSETSVWETELWNCGRDLVLVWRIWTPIALLICAQMWQGICTTLKVHFVKMWSFVMFEVFGRKSWQNVTGICSDDVIGKLLLCGFLYVRWTCHASPMLYILCMVYNEILQKFVRGMKALAVSFVLMLLFTNCDWWFLIVNLVLHCLIKCCCPVVTHQVTMWDP